MGSNGVSNIVVNDDSEGVEAILRWLSFVPLRIGDPLPFTDDGDSLQRIPTVIPDRNAHDPRPVLEVRGWTARLSSAHSFLLPSFLPSFPLPA